MFLLIPCYFIPRQIDPIIRKNSADDLPEIIPLLDKFNEFHDMDEVPNLSDLNEHWDTYDLWIVECDDQIVGFLAGYPRFRFHLGQLRYEVQSAFILKSYRGLGVGKQLFDHIQDRMMAMGANRFALYVNPENQSAKTFYEGIRYEFSSSTHDRYVMETD